MTVEERLRQDFADDTAYERLVLMTVVDPNRPPPGVVSATDDIRGNGPPSLGRGVYDSSSAGAVESFAARFRPLAFGAAYKIVDFVVEMTMRLNGEPCPRGRWTFVAKRVFTGRGVPARLPAPLDVAAASHWLRITQLYATFNEYRHAVVHRRTRLEPNGELAGVDQAGVALPPITVPEQDSFSRYATALSEVLIEATVNQRRLNAMAWYLDALNSHHGCGFLGASEPATIIVKVIDDLQPSSSGHWHLDGARLHAHLRGEGYIPPALMPSFTPRMRVTTSSMGRMSRRSRMPSLMWIPQLCQVGSAASDDVKVPVTTSRPGASRRPRSWWWSAPIRSESATRGLGMVRQ